jgi:hypothetical protein
MLEEGSAQQVTKARPVEDQEEALFAVPFTRNSFWVT